MLGADVPVLSGRVERHRAGWSAMVWVSTTAPWNGGTVDGRPGAGRGGTVPPSLRRMPPALLAGRGVQRPDAAAGVQEQQAVARHPRRARHFAAAQIHHPAAADAVETVRGDLRRRRMPRLPEVAARERPFPDRVAAPVFLLAGRGACGDEEQTKGGKRSAGGGCQSPGEPSDERLTVSTRTPCAGGASWFTARSWQPAATGVRQPAQDAPAL